MGNDNTSKETDLEIAYRLGEDFRKPYREVLVDRQYDDDMNDWNSERG